LSKTDIGVVDFGQKKRYKSDILGGQEEYLDIPKREKYKVDSFKGKDDRHF